MITLNQHIKNMEDNDERQEAIEKRAEEISDELLAMHVIKINGKDGHYHIDDFIADDVFNSGPVCMFLKGKRDDLFDELTEKFEKWCETLATIDVDNR